MILQHATQARQGTGSLQPVLHLVWSLNGQKLAAVTSDRVVHLYDDRGEKRDKFSTKAADAGGAKSYTVTAIVFSPDSSRLAIAQSDSIVFVYKLGVEWGEKKSICNKFPLSSAATAVAWPVGAPGQVLIGQADGKITVGATRTNRPNVSFIAEAPIVAMAAHAENAAVLAAARDGRVYLCRLDGAGPAPVLLLSHSCAATYIYWGRTIMCAGVNRVLSFYREDGQTVQHCDVSNASGGRAITCVAASAAGDTVLLGTHDAILSMSYSRTKARWSETPDSKRVEGLGTCTALASHPSGGLLVVGNAAGAIDFVEASVRRVRLGEHFELTYVSSSEVVVRNLLSGARSVLRSHFGHDIGRVRVHVQQYVTAFTSETLLVGDLETSRLSEVSWVATGHERFVFDAPSACMVLTAGELAIVEYGNNEVVAHIRTERLNRHLLSLQTTPEQTVESSVQRSEAMRAADPLKMRSLLAYLVDTSTLRVLDVGAGADVANVHHESGIDWLELGSRGTVLLFRDRQCKLHLFEVASQKKTTLLEYCKYAQWVPDSDVAVAQSQDSLCVWYSIDAPDKMTQIPIKGDVVDIIRTADATEVQVDEGIKTVTYALDETLIAFGTAVERGELGAAADALEDLELTAETGAMWTRLREAALAASELFVAERCAAALGDVAQLEFLRKTNEMRRRAEQALGRAHALDDADVRARCALLARDVPQAERIYLEHGRTEDAMEMYQDLQRWDRAVMVAEAKSHPDAAQLKEAYLQWLMDTGQEAQAGEVKERDGDPVAAANLFLRGRLPARAASLFEKRDLASTNPHLAEAIAAALKEQGLCEQAGNFLERIGDMARALEAYRDGKVFRGAVELARKHFPGKVVDLQNEWGDYLVAQKRADAAVNHFIESFQFRKAVEAAINARLWRRAIEVIDSHAGDLGEEYFLKIARHFRDGGNLADAERYYMRAHTYRDVVTMHLAAEKWSDAHRVASQFMPAGEVVELHVDRATELADQGRFSDAETLYLLVDEIDLAISMYKNARQFQNMIRLVAAHRADLLTETHRHLAQQLQSEGQYATAEEHFCEAQDWQSAAAMYRALGQWDEALRVAKKYGDHRAVVQVAHAWATAIGDDDGAKLVVKLGLAKDAIEYAAESGSFPQAFALARAVEPQLLATVHLRYAMWLEDEGRFGEAEAEFISAGKPREAIDMLLHNQSWDAALRVAGEHDPTALLDIHMAKGRAEMEARQFAQAETCFLAANRPDIAINMYRQEEEWEDALRIARAHAPNRVTELEAEAARAASATSKAPAKPSVLVPASQTRANVDRTQSGTTTADVRRRRAAALERARSLEKSARYDEAIAAFLECGRDELDTASGPLPQVEELEYVWEKAAQLALEHLAPARASSTVLEAARRLARIGRSTRGADLLREINAIDEAVLLYCDAGQFATARTVAHEHNPSLLSVIDTREQEWPNRTADAMQTPLGAALSAHNGRAGDGPATSRAGATGGGAGDMSSIVAELDQAVARDPAHVAFHVMECAQTLSSRGMAGGAAAVLEKYGCAPSAESAELVREVVLQLLRARFDDGQDWKNLEAARNVLNQLMQNLADPQYAEQDETRSRLARVHLAAHYTLALHRLQTHESREIAPLRHRVALACARYCDMRTPDYVLHAAAAACRELGWDEMAFVFYNLFIDVFEAIQGGEETFSIEDEEALEISDLPKQIDLPEASIIDEGAEEDAREWVLEASLNGDLNPCLLTRSCENCAAETYNAALECHNCGVEAQPCVVTGFPVAAASGVQCRSCKSHANRTDWNVYVEAFKSCPWCGSMQAPVYV